MFSDRFFIVLYLEHSIYYNVHGMKKWTYISKITLVDNFI